jgi:hypothetical protein
MGAGRRRSAFRDMGAGRVAIHMLGTFKNFAARLEKWAPISDELSSLWVTSLLRDELAPRVAPDPTRSRSSISLYFTVRLDVAPIVCAERWKLD